MDNSADTPPLRTVVAREVDLNALILSSKQHLETIFDSIADPILIIDRERRITRLNRAAAALIGREYKDILGKACYQIFHSRDAACDRCSHDEAFLHHRIGHRTVRITVNEKERIFDLRYFPLYEKNGSVKDLVEHYVDITEGETAKIRLEDEYRRIKTDLKTARTIQEALLPTALPRIPGAAIEVFYEPVDDIGGDLYDFINIDGEHWGFVIADVSGHGIPASLIGAMAKMSFFTHTPGNLSPLDVFEHVNKDLFNNLMMEYYISGAYAIYDPLRNLLRYSRAGHPDALIFRRKTGKVERLHARGYFLGILANGEYEQVEVAVGKGDRLFLYTDGISEAQNAGREKFTLDRVIRLLEANSELPLPALRDTVVSEVRAFAGDRKIEDDLTFVIVEFTEDNCVDRFGLKADFSDTESVRVHRAVHPFEFGAGLAKVLVQMEKSWYPIADRQNVQLAAYEALELLYKTSGDRTDGIYLAWHCDKEEVRLVAVDARYEGDGFFQDDYEKNHAEAVRIMREKMTSVSFPSAGRKILLIRRNSKY